MSLRRIGVDHVLFSKAALEGRFVHVRNACLIRRIVHIADTLEHQLPRITGQALVRPASYREMQRQLCSISP